MVTMVLLSTSLTPVSLLKRGLQWDTVDGKLVVHD